MKRLREIITARSLNLQVKIESWEEAVREAGRLLVEQEIAVSAYVSAMIAAFDKYGPYMVIAPGVALVHSRPGDGVIHTGLSLITLAAPVNFGNKENDPVSLVIAFAAANDEDHIHLLQLLGEWLLEEETIEVLRTANDKGQILSLCPPKLTGVRIVK